MHNGPIILSKIVFQRNGEKSALIDKSKQNTSLADAVRKTFKRGKATKFKSFILREIRTSRFS